ncbi:hypothetical protein NEPAR04_0488 [Nematocida parisii]|nr:hypothetical protein NEPAR03_0714 [Nematocida parisii]KAI5128298.1 hypothetical protein NEPAR08_1162 [Nematocida parisii]KAI5140771.1 hypothetical protein NEPAR04_0488 [Nematocida parisii]
MASDIIVENPISITEWAEIIVLIALVICMFLYFCVWVIKKRKEERFMQRLSSLERRENNADNASIHNMCDSDLSIYDPPLRNGRPTAQLRRDSLP